MTARRTQPLILMADDDATARLWCENTLAAAGFEVQTVENGEAALDVFRSDRPDLVLLDVEMPIMDGFSLCRAIRQQHAARSLPIVMLTGLDDSKSVQEAFHAGATDFICKPVHWPMLPHRLHYILRATANFGALAVSERNTQALLRALPDKIIVVDSQGRARGGFRAMNAADDIKGVVDVGMPLEDVLPDGVGRRVREQLPEFFAAGQPSRFECDAVANNQCFEVRMVPHGEVAIAIVRDITERKRADARIHQLAFFDPLTGLPNRPQMARQLDSLISDATRNDRGIAVLYLDLDNFKRINDTLGHSTGDRLLEEVAARLQTNLRSDDYLARVVSGHEQDVHLARLGGDEFVALVPNVDSEGQATALAERVFAGLRAPFCLGTHTLVVTPSVGIAMYPQDGRDVETLLMNADAAMYRAKSTGRNRYCIYSSTMNIRSLERLDIESELRRAIAAGSLLLHYQPQVSVSTGKVIGVEALLRWQHPERGWISPAQFVPIAEETGLMVSLGEWVIQTACRQLRAWSRGPLSDLHVAVNVSVRQFSEPGFANDLLSKVKQSRIRPNQLELEITESLFLRDVEENLRILRTIKDAGLRVSLDDFGTGYSSLSYLRRLALDAVKIDRSFVQDLHTDRDDAAISLAIIAMAHQLGLSVIAEGVELEEQMEFLRQHECDVVQGFLLGRPMSAEDLERTLIDERGTLQLAACARRA